MKKISIFTALICVFISATACAEPPPEVKREIERRLLESSGGVHRMADNTLIASDELAYDFMNTDNRFKVYFKKDPYAGEYNVKYQRGNSWIAFRSLSHITLGGGSFSQKQLRQRHLKEPGKVSAKDKNRFIYREVFKSSSGALFDAEYLISSTELLEEIVLDRPEDVWSISQEITLQNAELKQVKDAIHFYKPGTQQILFSIPPPKMYEKNNHGNENKGLHYKLKKLAPNRYRLTKVLDEKGKQWLADPRRVYPVVIDASLSFGSEYVFNSALTDSLDLVLLDSTHFVVAFRDNGNSAYGTAMIGTVSGTTISYGSEYVFNSAGTDLLNLLVLDSTHFVVGYRDYGNSFYGTAMIGTVSGTTISYGSKYVFNSGTTYSLSLAILESTHFVAGYGDGGNSDYGTAIIGTISGTSISYGSEFAFNSARTEDISLCALDSSHFVVGYQDYANSYYGTAIIGTVSGTTISYGSEYVFNPGLSRYTSLASLDSANFIAGYSDGGNSNYATCIIGSVSGTTISYGSEYAANSAEIIDINVDAFDTSNFVLAYVTSGASSHGYARAGTVSGGAISYGLESMFVSGSPRWLSVNMIDVSNFVIGYLSSVNYGSAIVGFLLTSKPQVIIVE